MFAEKPLSREEFKATTLALAGGRCCVPGCTEAAVDAHHILERRLWPDGGYYKSNGAPLCSGHHLDAEHTTIMVDQLRKWLGQKEWMLPPQFPVGSVLDKWGNFVSSNGIRFSGELGNDEAMIKALTKGGFISILSHSRKHPRTWHTPFSEGATSDDRVLKDMSSFEGELVTVTEKRDGECTTLEADKTFARSLDSQHHPSRDWLRAFWANVRMDIPERWSVVGEGLYARHSIAYDDLSSYFEAFQVWDDRAMCLDRKSTLEWISLIGTSTGTKIEMVPTLYEGIYDQKAIDAAWNGLLAGDRLRAAQTGEPLREREGYVIQVQRSFAYNEFASCVAKFVRKNHVRTDQHWMHDEIVPNGLQGTKE